MRSAKTLPQPTHDAGVATARVAALQLTRRMGAPPRELLAALSTVTCQWLRDQILTRHVSSLGASPRELFAALSPVLLPRPQACIDNVAYKDLVSQSLRSNCRHALARPTAAPAGMYR